MAILLHGLGSDGGSWELVGPTIGERFRCIAPDARGHGDSDWADDYSFPALVDDVRAVMDALGVLAAAVIGHSMGAATGYLLAATRSRSGPRTRAGGDADRRSLPTRRGRSRTDPNRANAPTGGPSGPSTAGATTPTGPGTSYADRVGCRTLVVGGVRSHLSAARPTGTGQPHPPGPLRRTRHGPQRARGAPGRVRRGRPAVPERGHPLSRSRCLAPRRRCPAAG